jgi:hypothetical protein
MPDHKERWEEYWRYFREHKAELRAKAREFMSEKRKVPEPTYPQKIEKAQLHLKRLESKIKRLNTLRSKWLRRLKAWQRLEDKSSGVGQGVEGEIKVTVPTPTSQML